MVDVKNREVLEKWLERQSYGVQSLIAARAALRVFPDMNELQAVEAKLNEPIPQIILPVLWALASIVSAGVWPDKIQGSVYISDAASGALAASAAARALTPTPTPTPSAAIAIFTAFIAANSNYIFSTEAADALQADVDFIDNGGTVKALSEKTLWHNADMPSDLSDHWQSLRLYLEDQDQDWQVWTDWYQDRLDGGVPLIEAIEIGEPDKGDYGRITLPKEYYKYPARLNAALKDKIFKYHAEQAEQAQSEQVPKDETPKIDKTPMTDLYDFEGSIAQTELEALKEAIEGLIPQEKYIEGQSNKTPIAMEEKDFLTLKAAVNALLEFQSVPQWERNIRSIIQSLVRILKDIDKLIDQLGVTSGKAVKLLKIPLRMAIEKMEAVLKSIKPSDDT